MAGTFLTPCLGIFLSFGFFSGLDLAPWQKVDLATLDLTNVQSRGRQPTARGLDPARQAKSYGPAARLQLPQLQQKRRFKWSRKVRIVEL